MKYGIKPINFNQGNAKSIMDKVIGEKEQAYFDYITSESDTDKVIKEIIKLKY